MKINKEYKRLLVDLKNTENKISETNLFLRKTGLKAKKRVLIEKIKKIKEKNRRRKNILRVT